MNQNSYISKILKIILPFGKKRFGWVVILSIVQGVLQALSIFSILPFLAFVTSPETIKNSNGFKEIEPYLPAFIEENLILSAGLILITLILLSNTVNLLSDYYRQKYSTHTALLIGTDLLTVYAYQPYAFHLSNNSGELIKRIQSDVNRFLAGGILPFIVIISTLINLFFILILLILVNWKVIVVSCMFFSVLVWISNVLFAQKMTKGSRERKEMESKRYQTGFQLLTGIKSATIHNAQQYFLKRFKKQWSVIANHDTFLAVASNGPRYVIEAVAFAGIVLLVLYLNNQNTSLQTVIPTLALFVMAAYRILPNFQVVNAQLNLMKSYSYTVDIITEDFIEKDKIKKNESDAVSGLKKELPFNHKIIVKGLYFRYSGASVDSLKNLNLEIVKGQRVGIIGASGAGKSTFVDIILGLLKPTKGFVQVDAQSLDNTNISTWRQKIGYVPQEIFLIDDTVIRNIAFGINSEDIDFSKIIKAAKLAQIDDFITTMSEGYDTICGDRGVKLSGGQRQRIVLARALYHEPEVLIFDEATSALDNETEKRLLESIESLPRDLTILQIAHRMETIKSCDLVFNFINGKLDSIISPKDMTN